MIADVDAVREEALSAIDAASTIEELDQVRIRYLTRKGTIAQLFDNMKTLSAEERPLAGKKLNGLRSVVQQRFDDKKILLESHAVSDEPEIDLTLPGRTRWVGSKHPITKTLQDIEKIFIGMGFRIATGPEIEDDYHNFSALNFPPDHPARDMQDTFFIEDKIMLRTHTSPVQIRVMESQQPPLRLIMPGRVYRNEAMSARSYCIFHQVEGLCVDTGVTFSDLKATLLAFARQFYGSNIRYRFRASYFPFTEPSAELDITCFLCSGKGCRVCKQSGWLEILGCGMVHPNVFKAVGYDAEIYSGYAFGMGIERITMLRYGIDDIRILFENDLRFLKQLA
jgi:phenylalanyl-tRNA synthetase alpha chain